MTDEEKPKDDLKAKADELIEGKQKTEEVEAADNLSEVTANFEKLKKVNDETEAELIRQEELRAKVLIGGKSTGAGPEETDEEIADKEAKEILDIYR